MPVPILFGILVTISDKKSGVDNSSDGEYDYYEADVVSASDYYPFGMQMPGRVSETSKYRYGFNGQEKSDELTGSGNSYTAEFWQYDARIGRRWNRDPVFKEYESPYATFGNNPIWNIDPNGADTSKYLNNAQLVDALKIASNEVKSVIKDKRAFFRSKTVDQNLLNASTQYWKEHQGEMNFASFSEFKKAVEQYYNGLATVAWWEGHSEFEKIDRSVINNKKVNNTQTVLITVGRIRETEAAMWTTMRISINTSLFISTSALFPASGAKPKTINSSNQTNISIRNAYETEVKGLSSWVKALRGQGASSEEIARTVHLQRRILGIKYKELTPAKTLEAIYKRNLEKYGDKLGPSIDYLRKQGKSWDDIIESASRPGGKDLNF